MEDNFNSIISMTTNIDKSELRKHIKDIIDSIKKAMNQNKDIIVATNNIDQKNNNGFIMDFEVVHNIFQNISEEKNIYGKVTLSQKDNEGMIVYGKQIMDLGLVLVINDGNPYVILEMVLRNLLAGNTTIFCNNGYMYGTNNLIIQIIQTVLAEFGDYKNLVQLYVSESFDHVLSCYANIDLIVCIGNRKLQSLVLCKAKNRVICSGYESFDLYIEDKSHMDFINKIIQTGLNMQIFVNKNLDMEHDNVILVDNIDEAIARINYTGSRYSAAIFTCSSENASKFIREVKTKTVAVNTSPTIERLLDIKQKDLINEKTIIYPWPFKISDNELSVEFNVVDE